QLPPPVARPRARIDVLYQQARRQASAGKTQEAARTYRELLDATKAHPQVADWRTLIEGRLMVLAPQRKPASPAVEPTRHDLLQLADRALGARRWGESADAYRRLLALPLPAELKARCLFGLAHAYEGQRDYRSARQTWALLEGPLGDALDLTSRKPYREL